MSQKNTVRKHLIDTGSISQMEALGIYRITRLAARIDELRKAGVPVKSETRHDRTGKRYVRYTLARPDGADLPERYRKVMM